MYNSLNVLHQLCVSSDWLRNNLYCKNYMTKCAPREWMAVHCSLFIV